jgi:4-amino-4-deoxy-L-arabinose transferase-like glycosyltransferase
MVPPDDINAQTRVRRGRWWHESEALLLIALVIGAYFWRGDVLTIRGEESRWATVAREMIQTGDWIVPRQQGEPFLSRPPLGNWLIALTSLARGQCDVWAVRLPTLSAVLLTTILVYAFGRSFLNRTGALAASLAFCTMGEVLQMGRLAETDLIFTCLLSSAMIVWLWGERRSWPLWLTWCGGYALAALAALAKGPQAPVYFFGTVVLFLVIRRDWRMLFSRWHLVGLSLFAVIVAAWQIPFTLAVGWDATRMIWTGDSAARFEHLRGVDVLKHLIEYPLELLGCTAPWSILLIAFLSRRFRSRLGELQPQVTCLTIYFVVGFLPCWASPGGMTRYCLPLYPALALLVGVVAQRVSEVALSLRLSRAWANSWRLYAASIVILAAVIMGIKLGPKIAALHPWTQPIAICLVFLVVSAAAATFASRTAVTTDRQAIRCGVLALAVVVAIAYAGIIVNALVYRSANAPAAIAALKNKLPAGTQIASLNGVHHLFAFLYGDSIDLHPWPTQDDSQIDWFCFSALGDFRGPLPFRWEEVAVISMDRNQHDKPENVVVVGRRLNTASVAANSH